MSANRPRARIFAMRDRDELVTVAACGIVLGYALSLVMLFMTHVWMLDARGHPQVQDFAAFWSAGHITLKGAASSAYDPQVQHAAEAAVFGSGMIAAFLHAVTITNDLRIAYAGMGWSKLESLYGLPRATGFPGTAAWAMQALVSVGVAIGVVLGWRTQLPYASHINAAEATG